MITKTAVDNAYYTYKMNFASMMIASISCMGIFTALHTTIASTMEALGISAMVKESTDVRSLKKKYGAVDKSNMASSTIITSFNLTIVRYRSFVL